MTQDEILNLRYKFAMYIPWPLSVQLLDKVHNQLISENNNWTIEDTAHLLDLNIHNTRKSIVLAKIIKEFPELIKITNKKKAYRLYSQYYNNKDIFRLKIAQEIQNESIMRKRKDKRYANK